MKFMPLVQKFQRRNLRSGVNDMTLRATCFHKHGVYIYIYISSVYIYSKSFVRYVSFVSYDSLVILTGAPSPSTALIWNQTTVRLFTSRLRGNEKTSHVLLWHVMTEVKHGCFDFLFLDINLIHIYIFIFIIHTCYCNIHEYYMVFFMTWPPVCSGGGMEPWRQGPHVLRGAQRWVMVLVSSYSRIASREWMRMARCCSAFLDFILSRFPNCDSSYLFRNRNSPKETEMLGVVKQFRMKLNGRQIHLSKNRTRSSDGSGGLGCLVWTTHNH